jgi:L-cysteine:1D-myo-inositol 2-amino-2-deoxy-alpha-D-glucopyranoside ligase
VRLFDETTGLPSEIEIRDRMGVYVCGVTPYDVSHIGHAFTIVQFDVLVRYLRSLGAEVQHVQNITDVDDDILRVARERNVGWRELGDREVERFERSMDALGVRPPTQTPRVTDFIPQIVEEVRALEAAGVTYARDGTVYFRVAADPDFGKLSRLPRDEMLKLAAERGGRPDDPAKEDPLDFVLWQKAEPGEPAWESPWGPGRPGWHIECSTMARRLLGQPIDIHGGGIDLVFPHHECETAQAEAVSNEPFVRHWMHTGNVSYRGEKMSKSLGNLVIVEELLERHAAEDVRRFLLSHHYRQSWEFREEDLLAPSPRLELDDPRKVFFLALDNDLDVPAALAALDASDDPVFVEEGRSILGLDT